jgi:LacI family transcriptional regulator
MITIKDIAMTSGYSIATVSRILNKKGNYSKETEKKVLEIAKKLGYIANLTARSLKTGLTRTIGIVLNEFYLSQYPSLISSVFNVLHANNFSLEVLLNTSLRECSRLLGEGKLDGLLITDIMVEPEVLRELMERAGDLVFLGGDIEREDVNLVEIDYFQGGYLATNQLISLGHSDILFIEDDESLFFTQEIKRGYLFSLDENGIQYKEPLIIQSHNGDSRELSGFNAVKHLFMDINYSAVLATDDKIAYGVLKAAREKGIKTPENLSVIGFGNMSPSEYTVPRLSTVEIPISQMGELGAEILLNNIIRKDRIVKRVKLKIQLIERESLSDKPVQKQSGLKNKPNQ